MTRNTGQCCDTQSLSATGAQRTRSLMIGRTETYHLKLIRARIRMSQYRSRQTSVSCGPVLWALGNGVPGQGLRAGNAPTYSKEGTVEVSVFAKNLEVTPRLREYVDKKTGKLDRYLPWIDEARVDLKVENTKNSAHRQVAQLTVRARGTILRAEERTSDMFSSIDAVLDKMYRQIARYKGKRKNRYQSASEELPIPSEEEAEEAGGEVVRVKSFELRPMTADEAIEQLELLGHHFYVFLNVGENSVNVVYRRNDGDYGLLQPELA